MFVSECNDLVCEDFHGSAVIDCDECGLGHPAWLIADDDRQVPLAYCQEIRVVVGDGVDDEGIDAGLLNDGGRCGVVTIGACRDEQQTLPRCLARFGQSGEKRHCGGVAERVAQRLGEHQTHCAGLAGAQ